MLSMQLTTKAVTTMCESDCMADQHLFYHLYESRVLVKNRQPKAQASLHIRWYSLQRLRNVEVGEGCDQILKNSCEPNNQLSVCTTSVTEGEVGCIKLV